MSTTKSRGSEVATGRPARSRLASGRVDGADDEMVQLMMIPPSSMVFKIFVDVAGMYRWLLIDDVGQRVQRSAHGFAGLAAAWNDAA
jgi:hypothetical protein